MVFYEFSDIKAKILKNLNRFRSEEICTDVKIIIEEKKFPAHKIVLMAMSEYFQGMFTGSFKENNSPEIKLSEEFVDSSIFEDILAFCYTKKIEINEDNAWNLCYAAHYLRLI